MSSLFGLGSHAEGILQRFAWTRRSSVERGVCGRHVHSSWRWVVVAMVLEAQSGECKLVEGRKLCWDLEVRKDSQPSASKAATGNWAFQMSAQNAPNLSVRSRENSIPNPVWFRNGEWALLRAELLGCSLSWLLFLVLWQNSWQRSLKGERICFHSWLESISRYERHDGGPVC